MQAAENVVLTINAGSSSIKFALYQITNTEEGEIFSGRIDMGSADAKIKYSFETNAK